MSWVFATPNIFTGIALPFPPDFGNVDPLTGWHLQPEAEGILPYGPLAGLYEGSATPPVTALFGDKTPLQIPTGSLEDVMRFNWRAMEFGIACAGEFFFNANYIFTEAYGGANYYPEGSPHTFSSDLAPDGSDATPFPSKFCKEINGFGYTEQEFVSPEITVGSIHPALALPDTDPDFRVKAHVSVKWQVFKWWAKEAGVYLMPVRLKSWIEVTNEARAIDGESAWGEWEHYDSADIPADTGDDNSEYVIGSFAASFENEDPIQPNPGPTWPAYVNTYRLSRHPPYGGYGDYALAPSGLTLTALRARVTRRYTTDPDA